MNDPPRVLVLGGLDPTGGAGITADVRTVAAHGAFALPIALALTVQNRRGFRAAHEVPADQWRPALAAALADGPVHAIKVGLLASVAQAAAVAAELTALPRALPVVIDPVLSATAGGYDAGAALAAAYRQVLAPLAHVLTPNLPECAAILGERPLATLLDAGGCAVLRKGGHGQGDLLVDELVTGLGTQSWSHERLPVGPVHGTGCALASALAAHLARGADLTVATTAAIGWLQHCLRAMGPPAADGLPRPLWILPGQSNNDAMIGR
ncbi:MAG: bifunctional hydroxymethylpyrimidine kinase/phosphomethylpyrimidine kinase [Planctomycetes bacterium]|nr:bifunctional hydroxymethylpyrimidine kinase/phosphomethylpyrimidine kinase [Planctomycetota bacterium]